MSQGAVYIHFAIDFRITVKIAQTRPKTAPQRNAVHAVDFIIHVEMEPTPEVVAPGIGGVFLKTDDFAAFRSGLIDGDVGQVVVTIH